MTKSVWIGPKGHLLRAAALGVVMALSACGGGGGDSASPATGPALAALSEVGVTAVAVADGASPVYLMTGKQEALSVTLQLDSTTAANDLSVTTAGKGVLPVTKDANGAWQLQIDASAMGDGETVPVQITITNSKLNKYAVATAQLSFVAPVSTRANIGSAGGMVGPPEAPVQILPNDLASPVGITVRRAVLPDGQTVLIDVALDADIGDATVPFRLPPPPVMTANSQSANKQARALTASRLDFNPSDGDALKAAWAIANPYAEDKEHLQLSSNDSWLTQMAWFSRNPLPLFRFAIKEGCLRSAPYFEGQTCWKIWNAVGKAASDLNSIVPKAYDSVAWKNFEPVMFVHGFNMGSEMGGGQPTWKQFPVLAKNTSLENGHAIIPFEFRWNTNASFKEAGRDLANAIQLVNKITGKPVNIVAHSFGGVLARVVLEEIAMPDVGTAKNIVKSLITLGAPHSGIATLPAKMFGVDLPLGIDSQFINSCAQVSCHEMGELATPFQLINKLSIWAGSENQPGEIPALLYTKLDTLPEMPIRVGIGLSISSLFGTYGFGDNLISFQGQRFLPNVANGQLSPLLRPLKYPTLTGSATVTEFVMGVNPDMVVFPLNAVKESDHGIGWMDDGYYHSTAVVIDHNSTTTGIEPGPFFGCDANAPELCPHAGYQAFLQLVRDIYPYVPPPTATFSASSYTPQAGQTVNFDASESTPGLGAKITAYTWSFGDGQYGTGATVSHSYSTAATYAAVAIVTDNDGQLSSARKDIVVGAAPPSPPPPPAMSFTDQFDGTALQDAYWTTGGTGTIAVTGGTMTSSCRAYATTQNKVTFSGSQMVVEGKFFGSGGLRDTAVSLVDVATGEYIQAGDTSYGGSGLYAYGSGSFALPQSGNGVSVNIYKEYRLTLNGRSLKLERGDTLANVTETVVQTLGSSIAGRTFFLNIGTGGSDYCPGTYDWITVNTRTATPDTGVTAAQCFAAGSDMLVNCTSAAAIALNDKQDGMTGLDVTASNGSDGKLGFSYSLVPKFGGGFYDKTECVKDNLTGLVWEGKISGGGLRDTSLTYTNWGDGSTGDTSTYVSYANSIALCGYTDWRLPVRSELLSIVDFGASNLTPVIQAPGFSPAIDSTWFVNTNADGGYWTSTAYADNASLAYYVGFNNGNSGPVYRTNSPYGHVRLVR